MAVLRKISEIMSDVKAKFEDIEKAASKWSVQIGSCQAVHRPYPLLPRVTRARLPLSRRPAVACIH